MQLKELEKIFTDNFGEGEYSCFHSPGRVNLIGEHTDYNGGYVFPCALSFGTYGIIRKRNDNILKFASTDFDLQVEIDLDDLEYKKEHDWANYLKGVVKEFVDMGVKLSGFEIMISGNIPNASGLSSSSSVEVLAATMLNEMFDAKIDKIEIVKLCQRVENNYIGVQTGIMDQFAICMGKENFAMFLNCDTLDFQYVPIKLDNFKLIISNTKKRRELADSKYNERRGECDEACRDLGINLLADITPDEFEKNKHKIKSEVVLNRATHVIYEIDRTVRAVTELKNGNISTFGELMNQSHESLKDLYEVSCKELDVLVSEALKIKGTVGSRMTGAGFGGCTVSIVENDFVDEFIKTVGENYKKEIGHDADFYLAEIGDGAKFLDI